ncbi:unnamed protein product, partial [Symbiodinium natans]
FGSGEEDTISADRRYLTSGGGRRVVLHDYRDLKFLKRVSAIGVFGSLMSSSSLAYAVSLGWNAELCAFLVFQTAGAALALYAYLRTYIARAVLDPRRAQLLIT